MPAKSFTVGVLSKLVSITIKKEAKTMANKGGSSQPNGPNQTARNAANSVSLTKGQQEIFQRTLENNPGPKTYQDLKEIAQETKENFPKK